MKHITIEFDTPEWDFNCLRRDWGSNHADWIAHVPEDAVLTSSDLVEEPWQWQMDEEICQSYTDWRDDEQTYTDWDDLRPQIVGDEE